MVENILITTCTIQILICIYALIRNEWVYRKVVSLRHGTALLLQSNRLRYRRLVIVRFWCWNFDKLIEDMITSERRSKDAGIK